MRHTFIMRTNYDDIFQTLPAAQAGELIQAVYAYVSGRDIPAFSAPAVEIAFKCLHKDLAYDVSKYEEVCAKRAVAGRKGGRSKKTNCLPSENSEVPSKAKHDEDEYEDEEMR